MLIQPYQKSWADDFNEIKTLINTALSHLIVSVEHVGSTSVPGLDAKPIIDIDIVFDKNAAFNEIKMGLAAIGYCHGGNQGIADREVFKRNPATAKHDVLDSIAHHLYACPAHSEAFQKHILFRDWLIANENASLAYQCLKYDIAKEANQDKKKYAELKEVKAADFINGMIENARKNIRQAHF